MAEDARNAQQFLDKSVLLRGDKVALATANGQTILRTAARLLIRSCPRLVVACDEQALRLQTETVLKAAEGGGSVVSTTEVDSARFDAIVSIGTTTERDRPDTCVWSDGWCARVSSHDSIEFGLGSDNPVGAVAAACLGAGEVFKRLIDLKRSEGRLLNRVSFSLYDYTESIDPGPTLTAFKLPTFLQVGAGAIGNGIALTLLESRATGSAIVLDSQDYERENWGTCVLMNAGDEGRPKAVVIAEHLNASGLYTATPVQLMVEQFRGSIPPIVISAVDSPEARHAIQLLWPDLIIDGAIGPFPCEVGVHPWGPDIACLRCWYQLSLGPRAEMIQAEASGIPEHLLADADGPVTEMHIRAAPPDRREFLRERLGKPICSVLEEAVAAAISAGKLRSGFRPSVPFVACLSGAMVVGELFKYANGLETVLEPRYQFDFRWGPGPGLRLPMARLPSCDCVRRRDQIERIRAGRASSKP
jgi:hypothetical protein